MNVTILDKSRIKYAGRYLTAFQTYNDIDEVTASKLVRTGDAQEAAPEIAAVSVNSSEAAPKTPKFDVKKNKGYVAEAVIDPVEKEKLEEEGKLDDGTPVVGEDTTQPKDEEPEPATQTEVLGEDGKPLTEDEIAAKEAAAAGGASEANPTVEQLQGSGEELPKPQ